MMAMKHADAPMAQDNKWRAESDVRTLTEASAIRKDKARFARAQACAKEQLAAMQAVVSTKKD